MGPLDEGFGGGPLEARQVHVELNGQAEATRCQHADAHARRDLRVADVEAVAERRELERRVEAGGVSGCEELLRVGRASGSAELFGDADVDVYAAVDGQETHLVYTSVSAKEVGESVHVTYALDAPDSDPVEDPEDRGGGFQ